MPDAPRLPDSPLAELHVPALPPDVQRWRTRAQWVGGAFVTLYGVSLAAVGVIAVVVAGGPGGMGGIPPMEILAAVVLFPAPALLLGLSLLRLAARWGKWNRAVGVVTILVPVPVAAGHVYVMMSSSTDAGAIAYCSAMLAADAATLLVGALGRHRLAKPAALAAVLAIGAALAALGVEIVHDAPSTSDPLEVVLMLVLAGVPTVATIASAWLTLTVPPARGGEVTDA